MGPSASCPGRVRPDGRAENDLRGIDDEAVALHRYDEPSIHGGAGHPFAPRCLARRCSPIQSLRD